MVQQRIANNGKDRKITIKNVKLRKDMYGYSLDMTYTVETPEEISELHIPRVMLPISNKDIVINCEFDYYGGSLYTADVGFGECRVLESDGEYFTLKTIETKTKEMTLEEIEKKLGHKVKIVNK
jgi:hypothetical protein